MLFFKPLILWAFSFALFLTPIALAETKKPYILDGFRSAKFGMSISEAKKAVIKDFKVRDRAFKPIEGQKHAFAVQLQKMHPFNSPARIEYYFDRGSMELKEILVRVTEKSKSEIVQQDFIRKVLAAIQYVHGKELSAFDMSNPRIFKEGVLVLGLYSKNKVKRSAFEMVVLNLDARIQDGGMVLKLAKDASKPMVLQLSYVAHVSSDEKIIIKDGSF